MTFEINKPLLEKGKIELMKEQLNELEALAKMNTDAITVNAMRKVMEKYGNIKSIGPEVDSGIYDSRLNEIVLSSNKKQFFY